MYCVSVYLLVSLKLVKSTLMHVPDMLWFSFSSSRSSWKYHCVSPSSYLIRLLVHTSYRLGMSRYSSLLSHGYSLGWQNQSRIHKLPISSVSRCSSSLLSAQVPCGIGHPLMSCLTSHSRISLQKWPSLAYLNRWSSCDGSCLWKSLPLWCYQLCFASLWCIGLKGKPIGIWILAISWNHFIHAPQVSLVFRTSWAVSAQPSIQEAGKISSDWMYSIAVRLLTYVWTSWIQKS